jgi:peptide/nickel transport system ATP-binding protein
MTAIDSDELLRIENLSLEFETVESSIQALNHISFSINKDEIVALVGESGCGKSVTAMSIMRLLKTPPARYIEGRILFNGEDLLAASDRRLREIRGNKISMIFQEPMTSLNPIMTIESQVAESLSIHTIASKKEIKNKVVELLQKVRIPSASERVKSYPTQFSGGMRQRVMIAMAISCNPDLLIADEPTTALDVTIQAQILELLRQLKQETHMSILLITHDLGVVAEFADRVMVMYAGEIVEMARTIELFRSPQHPYTQGLLNSLPKLNDKAERLSAIPGYVPSLSRLPSGCRFHPRCKYALPICSSSSPEIKHIADGHLVRCFLL